MQEAQPTRAQLCARFKAETAGSRGIIRIALMGSCGAGKDYTATLIGELCGGGDYHYNVAVAAPLKTIALFAQCILYPMYGLPHDVPDKRLCQKLGMFFREFDAFPAGRVWCDLAQHNVAATVAMLGSGFHPGVRAITVSDCRFPEEYTMLKEQGFRVWRIEGKAVDNSGSGRDLNHASETAWKGLVADAVLDNTNQSPAFDALVCAQLLAEIKSCII